jgi:hypothetical protein
MDMSWRKSSYSTTNGGACIEVGVWRKSSRSSPDGSNCVEVATAPWGTAPRTSGNAECAAGSTVPWRTSSRSNSSGACVETATIGATVAVRDTKDNGHGPVLRFTPPAWQAFTATLK